MSNRRPLLGIVAVAALLVLGLSFFRPLGGARIDAESLPLLQAMNAQPLEQVEAHQLQRGQTLDGVLYRAGFAGSELNALLLAIRQFINPRALPVGLEVRVRRWAADGEARALEVRVNADTTVVLEAEPETGWDGALLVTPTIVDTVYMAGEITAGGSVYDAILADLSVEMRRADRIRLVSHLADEVYSFTLAFSHQIREGDSYRLVYEREVRPDGSVRLGRVLVAELNNQGRVFPAVFFDSPGARGYYDRNGEALRRMFRRAPLDHLRITSSFSHSRFHPVLGVNRPHVGVDFGAATGTPVYATADGVVASAGWDGGYGNIVIINHAGGYSTRYAHLSRFAAGIRAGRRVSQNDLIGYVGATGLATGPHLHYELRRNGVALNPMTVQLPGAPPIPAALREEYGRVRDQRLALLEQLEAAGPRLASSDGEQRERGIGPD